MIYLYGDGIEVVTMIDVYMYGDDGDDDSYIFIW